MVHAGLQCGFEELARAIDCRKACQAGLVRWQIALIRCRNVIGRRRQGCRVRCCVGRSRCVVSHIASPHVITADHEPHAGIIGHWPGENGFALCSLRLEFIANSRHRLEVGAGIRGGDRDYASGTVLAEEQRLRTFEDLHLIQVDEAFVDDATLAVVDAVDDQRD